MKSFSFSSVPEMTSDMVRKSKFSINSLTASFFNGNDVCTLGIEVDKVMAFTDALGIWSIEESGLNLDIKGDIGKIDYLFSEYGIARPGDELGIAFRVSSADSRQRLIFGSYPYSINKDTQSLQFDCHLEISPGKIRIKALLEMILYVKSSIIGTVSGTVLGVLYSQLLSFSGDGSQFPIATGSFNEPFLWKLEMEYDDLHTDPFSECVRVVINTNHHLYSQLQFDKNPLNSGLFIDIFSNAVVYFLQKLQSDEQYIDVKNNQNLLDGSVGAAAREMIQTYVQNSDDVLKMSEDVQKYITKKINGE